MRRQKSKRSAKLPPACARRDDRFDRGLAGALDAAEPVANALAVDGLEAIVRRVDVRRQDRQPEADGIVAQVAHLVGVVHDEREVRGHERGRMVRLEVRGLVRDERVRGGVRLVEAVARELLHEVEELRRLRLGDAVLHRALDEDAAMLGHLLGLLLAHRAAQEVGAAQRVAADLLGDLHHLFLVHHHAVRRRQDRLQARIHVRGALAPRLARDEVGDELHRAGPVERDERDDVLEARDRRLLQELAHAARFELEHGGGVAGAEDRERALVVERQRIEVDRRRRIEHPHVADGPVEDRQRRESEEVELHEPDRLDVVLVELRDDRVGVRLHVQRAEVGELAGRDQHAARVHADVARKAFELLGERQELAHFLLGALALVDQRLDLARVDHVGLGLAFAPLERHELARLEGNELGDAVDERIRKVEDAADIAYGGFGGERAERRDLRHRVGAVLLLHVIDDAVAAVLAEIDVEVRHRHPLGIEEALEQQRVAQRIEVGDAERVRDERSGARSAARPHRARDCASPS